MVERFLQLSSNCISWSPNREDLWTLKKCWKTLMYSWCYRSPCFETNFLGNFFERVKMMIAFRMILCILKMKLKQWVWVQGKTRRPLQDENPRGSFCDSFVHLIEAMNDSLFGTHISVLRQEDSEFQDVVSDFSSVNQEQLKRWKPWRTVFLHMYLFLDKCVCLKVWTLWKCAPWKCP